MNLQLSKQTYNNFLKYFQKNFDLDKDIKDAFNYIDTPLDLSDTVKITFTTTTCSDVHNDIRVTIEFNTYVIFMFYVSVMDHYASTATSHDYYLHGGASLFVIDPNSHEMDNRREMVERFPLEDDECRELISCMDSKDQDNLFYFVPAFADVFGSVEPVSESRRIRGRKVSAGRKVHDKHVTSNRYVRSDKSVDDSVEESANNDIYGFHYSFAITRMIMFDVNYATLGSNKNPYFSTSAAVFNRPKTDWTSAGQGQERVLPKGSYVRKFWEKWDSKHLKKLTDEEFEELVSDIEVLKSKYKYIEEIFDIDDGDAGRHSISFWKKKNLSMGREI